MPVQDGICQKQSSNAAAAIGQKNLSQARGLLQLTHISYAKPICFEQFVAEFKVSWRTDVAGMGDIDGEDLLNPRRPRAQDDDSIGELHGFIDVVRDKDDRAPFSLPNAEKLAAHDHAGDGIQGAEWLVKKENVGIDRESAGDLKALFHAAR